MKITIVDDLPPEAIAMTQALYSRSPNYVDAHLAKVKEVGADKFMDKFYVGYGGHLFYAENRSEWQSENIQNTSKLSAGSMATN